MPINNKLKQIRTAAKLTQKEFAKLIGTTHNAVVEIERGRYVPITEEQITIADVLNVDVEELGFPVVLTVDELYAQYDVIRDEAVYEAGVVERLNSEVEGTMDKIALLEEEKRRLNDTIKTTNDFAVDKAEKCIALEAELAETVKNLESVKFGKQYYVKRTKELREEVEKLRKRKRCFVCRIFRRGEPQ